MVTTEAQLPGISRGGEEATPVASRPGNAAMAARIAAYYREVFGWSVRGDREGNLFLLLENGLCAIVLPKPSAAGVLQNLADTECRGPVLDLPTQRGARLAILAETNGLIPPADRLPRDVALLHSGARIPLPVNHPLQRTQVSWLTPPDPRRRWLPSLFAVLASMPSRPGRTVGQRAGRKLPCGPGGATRLARVSG